MISINNRDPRPIYAQVKNEFRKLIVSGVLLPDDRLPSVREIASSLAINPNTIQRAYRELEAEGYIYSLPGKGSFVGEVRDSGAGRKSELFKMLDDIVSELLFLGVGKSELCARIEGGKLSD